MKTANHLDIAFIGLGVMGFPMAGHLSTTGHRLTVHNRSAEKTARWLAEYNGRGASTPAQAAENADIVVACVGNDDDVRAITLGDEGVFPVLKEGAVFIDHTTTSASLAQELAAEAASLPFEFLDAPVSGGQAGAENAQLTVMVGGEEETFVRVQEVLSCYAQKVQLMGAAGSGQLTKMVNQICIAGLVQGLAEGINFAQRAGLDVSQVVDVISKGAAQSWQMENRWQTMLEDHYEHGFAVDWMRKDLGFVFDEAQRIGVEVPVTTLVDQFYAEVQRMGGGRWDTSSLLARLHANTNGTD
ncbi:MAG: NAD(P)-dependent oxidoreductase [Pseudomonadales bacterium]